MIACDIPNYKIIRQVLTELLPFWIFKMTAIMFIISSISSRALTFLYEVKREKKWPIESSTTVSNNKKKYVV